ncbi:FAD:protein FMN transferase [Clostridium sp. D2Q-11]|uniref:FAD:protein FMN transferase n=1 Tax=Anaeromonas frigoriresistens TaxID=2683708 RepID=A0A942UVM1_9FIRM|nr:FAD:protein FMN transferase [Anaeromonas frigoriresistens]MBS4538875.1 FAD:protein FMN transferase [Anaeromonas frigoriresistens]
MINYKKYAFLLLILFSILITGCSEDGNGNIAPKSSEPVSENGFYLGTIINISIYDEAPEGIFEKVFNRIEEIENKMSLNIEDSEINKINYNAGKDSVKVSQDTYNVIERGKFYSDKTEGHFDITIGPLVELWQIGTENARVPTKEEIENNLPLVDYQNVVLDNENKSIYLDKEDMILDLGGIAKGYAADEVAKILKENNINHAIVNLGGNVLALGGKPDGSNWKIGVQNPYEPRGKHVAIVSVKDKTVVSSGVYERNFEEDGKLYHHILDPFTGYPIENSLQSVTIVADESFDADGLSTGIFALGLERGMNLVENTDGVDAIFITNEKQVYLSSELIDKIELTNNDFTLSDNK